MKKKDGVVEISSFDELKKVMDEPFACSFQLSGQKVRLPLRRLTGAEMEQVFQVRNDVPPPPFRPGTAADAGRYEYLDPKYLAAKEKANRQAQALMVYKGCPAIASGKTGLTGKEEIAAYVASALPQIILDTLEGTLGLGGLEVIERVNFTSTTDSVPS
jgi:hypothetical protein